MTEVARKSWKRTSHVSKHTTFIVFFAVFLWQSVFVWLRATRWDIAIDMQRTPVLYQLNGFVLALLCAFMVAVIEVTTMDIWWIESLQLVDNDSLFLHSIWLCCLSLLYQLVTWTTMHVETFDALFCTILLVLQEAYYSRIVTVNEEVEPIPPGRSPSLARMFFVVVALSLRLVLYYLFFELTVEEEVQMYRLFFSTECIAGYIAVFLILVGLLVQYFTSSVSEKESKHTLRERLGNAWGLCPTWSQMKYPLLVGVCSLMARNVLTRVIQLIVLHYVQYNDGVIMIPIRLTVFGSCALFMVAFCYIVKVSLFHGCLVCRL